MKKNKYSYGTLVCILSLVMLSYGCRVDITPPEVISYSPPNQSCAGDDTVIQLKFNKKMKRTETEKAFSLYNGNEIIEGKFSWITGDKSFTYTPHEKLENGYYRMVLSRNAIDTDGVTLKTEHISSFFVGNDRYPPEVISVNPESLERNYPLDGVITITFSEPMDQMSVQRGIRISPATEGSFTWNPDNTVVSFVPFNNLAFNTEYTITITTGCADIHGNTLVKNHVSFFKSGDEFERPDIISIYASSSVINWATFDNYHVFNNVEHNDIFTFTFSEPVNRQSFESSLRFNPAIDTNCIWNSSSTECVVIPSTELIYNETYQLLVTTTLKDLAGNSMLDEMLYLFTVDAVSSSPPGVSSIECDGYVFITGILNEPGEENPLALNTYVFDVLFTMDVDRTTVPGNIIIERLNGEAPGIGGSIQQYQWTPGDDRNLALTLTSIEGGNTYRLTFRGGQSGITGINDVHMHEVHVIIFRFDPAD